MPHRPLYAQDYRPQFSGHETFPLRYGWLKKAFDRVAETEDTSENKSLCWGEDAIARFGVGKIWLRQYAIGQQAVVLLRKLRGRIQSQRRNWDENFLESKT